MTYFRRDLKCNHLVQRRYRTFAVDLFQESKKLIVRKLESCKGKRHLPMVFQNLTVARNPETDGVDFDFYVVVKREISNNLAVSARFANIHI